MNTKKAVFLVCFAALIAALLFGISLLSKTDKLKTEALENHIKELPSELFEYHGQLEIKPYLARRNDRELIEFDKDNFLVFGISGNIQKYNINNGKTVVIKESTEKEITHSAMKLFDRRILIISSVRIGTYPKIANKVRIYSSDLKQFKDIKGFNVPRAYYATTQFDDGQILFSGGVSKEGKPLGSFEIFDPYTEKFILYKDRIIPRTGHYAFQLLDGSILIVGGASPKSNYPPGENHVQTREVEIINMNDLRGSPAGFLRNDAIGIHLISASLLNNGKVLLTNSYGGFLYHPSSRSYTKVPDIPYCQLHDSSEKTLSGLPLQSPQPGLGTSHSTARSQEGDILFIGGFSYPKKCSIVNRYDSGNNKWIPIGKTKISRGQSILMGDKLFIVSDDKVYYLSK